MPLPATSTATSLHTIDGIVFARSAEAGLFRVEAEKLVLISAAPEILGGGDFTLLLGTRPRLIVGRGDGSLHELDEAGRVRRLEWAADGLLSNLGLTGGVALRGGRQALVTRASGVLLIEPNGAVWQRVDQARGLASENVHGLCEDRDGSLWLATDYGATRATTTSGSNHIRYIATGVVVRLTTDASITATLEESAFYLDDSVTLLLGPDETVQGSVAEVGRHFLEETVAYWSGWVRQLGIPFEWQDAVIRAAITLELNVFDDTGAVIAAVDRKSVV